MPPALDCRLVGVVVGVERGALSWELEDWAREVWALEDTEAGEELLVAAELGERVGAVVADVVIDVTGW